MVKKRRLKGEDVLFVGGQRNERPSAIVCFLFFFFLRKVKYIRFRNTLGGGMGAPWQLLALQGLKNGKGPLSRTVAPCEPNTFVKGEGVKSEEGVGAKRKKEKKSHFQGFLHQRTARCVQRDNEGRNRFSWSEKILIFSPLHLCCPCGISLHGFKDL